MYYSANHLPDIAGSNEHIVLNHFGTVFMVIGEWIQVI
jgi:hypothetical protein